jgi:hypothetical protein
LPWQLLSLLPRSRFPGKSPARKARPSSRQIRSGSRRTSGSALGLFFGRRSDEHGPFNRQLGRGLLQHDIRRCCFLGTTSFGSCRFAMSTALAPFFGMLLLQRLFAEKRWQGPGGAREPFSIIKKGRSPQGLTWLVQGPAPPGIPAGAPALAPPRGASRAYATHILAAQGPKTHVSSN